MFLGQFAKSLLTTNPWFDETTYGLAGNDAVGINLVVVDLGKEYAVIRVYMQGPKESFYKWKGVEVHLSKDLPEFGTDPKTSEHILTSDTLQLCGHAGQQTKPLQLFMISCGCAMEGRYVGLRIYNQRGVIKRMGVTALPFQIP